MNLGMARRRWAIRRDYVDIDGTVYPNFVFKHQRVWFFNTRREARIACAILRKGWDTQVRDYNPYATKYRVIQVIERITEI
jgi:hypothetical protein